VALTRGMISKMAGIVPEPHEKFTVGPLTYFDFQLGQRVMTKLRSRRASPGRIAEAARAAGSGLGRAHAPAGENAQPWAMRANTPAHCTAVAGDAVIRRTQPSALGTDPATGVMKRRGRIRDPHRAVPPDPSNPWRNPGWPSAVPRFGEA
jgi:hypothetical protein